MQSHLGVFPRQRVRSDHIMVVVDSDSESEYDAGDHPKDCEVGLAHGHEVIEAQGTNFDGQGEDRHILLDCYRTNFEVVPGQTRLKPMIRPSPTFRSALSSRTGSCDGSALHPPKPVRRRRRQDLRSSEAIIACHPGAVPANQPCDRCREGGLTCLIAPTGCHTKKKKCHTCRSRICSFHIDVKTPAVVCPVRPAGPLLKELAQLSGLIDSATGDAAKQYFLGRVRALCVQLGSSIEDIFPEYA